MLIKFRYLDLSYFKVNFILNPYPANIVSSRKCCLLNTSAAYVQMLQLKTILIMEANIMKKASEFDQEIPLSHTAAQPMAP